MALEKKDISIHVRYKKKKKRFAGAVPSLLRSNKKRKMT